MHSTTIKYTNKSEINKFIKRVMRIPMSNRVLADVIINEEEENQVLIVGRP